MTMVHLFLTCAHLDEAKAIASRLLEKRLVACIKMIPVTSKFIWKGSVAETTEILLIMDSEESKFDAIEKEIRTIHSYTTFVLTATEIKKTSSGVSAWISESIK